MVGGLGRAEVGDDIFRALTDATRRNILAVGLHADHSGSELARRSPISFSAGQKHVAALDGTGS